MRAARHAVGLRERAQPDETILERRRQQLAVVDEIGVRFVEQQQAAARQPLIEADDLVARDEPAARIVGIRKVHDRRRVAARRREQRVAVGRAVVPIAGVRRPAAVADHVIVEGRIRAAGRQRGRAGCHERAHREPHQIVDARADQDLVGAAAVLLRERVAQVEGLRIAVPREPLELRAHRGNRLRRGAERALVRPEANELAQPVLAHQLLGTDEGGRCRNRLHRGRGTDQDQPPKKR